MRSQRRSSRFSDGMTRIDLEMDVPTASADVVRVGLTDTIVRIAEAMRREDDVYHVLYREAALDEADLERLESLDLEIADGAGGDATIICQRSSSCPRDKHCLGPKQPRLKPQIDEIRESVLTAAS